MIPQERRTAPEASEQELYQAKDIASFIETERRHDQLDRLREVQAQKRVWRRTMIFCGLLNGIFIVLAIIGSL